MTEVHQLPQMERVEEEASLWIARLNADEVSAEDRARFEAWHGAHPLHARAYESLTDTWGRFAAAGPWVRAVSIGQALNETTRVASAWPRRLAVAAAIAVLAVSAFWYWSAHPSERVFQTAIGEHAAISLPDGSTLELNSGSVAHVDYSDAARVIHLERGEGFFKVAPDKTRPFWVGAGNSWVRALGTAFNVYLRSSGMRVTVSEGRVKVSSADGLGGRVPTEANTAQSAASVLAAGQQLDLQGDAVAVRDLPANEISRSVAWRGGTVNFEKQTLGEVIQELDRYTTLQLIVEDESLRRLWVGGTFETNPQGVEDFIAMLQGGLGLHVQRESGKVYIERAPRR